MKIFRLLDAPERAEFDRRAASQSLDNAIEYGLRHVGCALEGLSSFMELASRVRLLLDTDGARAFDERAASSGLAAAITDALGDMEIQIESWPALLKNFCYPPVSSLGASAPGVLPPVPITVNWGGAPYEAYSVADLAAEFMARGTSFFEERCLDLGAPVVARNYRIEYRFADPATDLIGVRQYELGLIPQNGHFAQPGLMAIAFAGDLYPGYRDLSRGLLEGSQTLLIHLRHLALQADFRVILRALPAAALVSTLGGS